MSSLISRTARTVGACAVMALSIFSAAPKPAEACFMVNSWIDDCSMVYNQVCSYNGNGTGGYYVARAGVINIC